MRALYAIRVIFVSLEFLVLALSFAGWFLFFDYISDFVLGNSLNEKAVEWILLYPVSIAVWVIKEAGSVLFPSERMDSILHEWDGYWKLRVHYNTGLFYCVAPVVPCFYIWLMGFISKPLGLWVFLTCSMVSSVSAFSFYQANIRLKEILIKGL